MTQADAARTEAPCCDDARSDAEVRAEALAELVARVEGRADAASPDALPELRKLAARLSDDASEGARDELALRIWARHAAGVCLGRFVDCVQVTMTRAQESLDAGDAQHANLVTAIPLLVRAGERLVFAARRVGAPAGASETVVDTLGFAATALDAYDARNRDDFLVDVAWAIARGVDAAEKTLAFLRPEVPGVERELCDTLSGWGAQAAREASGAPREALAAVLARFERALAVAFPLLKYGRARGPARKDSSRESTEAGLAHAGAAAYDLAYALEQLPNLARVAESVANRPALG